ncbi:MAG: hypothetical protein ACFFCZ_06715 [Promethearchaeota archaeon]
MEQTLGYDKELYSLYRLPHLGLQLSHQFIGLVNCKVLLNALTAVKTDQFHLISRPGAFRNLGLDFQGLTLAQVQQLQDLRSVLRDRSPRPSKHLEPFNVSNETLKPQEVKWENTLTI